MMKAHTQFEAVVRLQEAKSAKCRAASELTIFLGPVCVASKIVGGKWNEQQALAEFRRHPNTFDFHTEKEPALQLLQAA